MTKKHEIGILVKNEEGGSDLLIEKDVIEAESKPTAIKLYELKHDCTFHPSKYIGEYKEHKSITCESTRLDDPNAGPECLRTKV